MRKRTILLFMILLLILTGCGVETAPTETAAAEPITLNMQELYNSLTSLDTIPEMLTLDSGMQLNYCGIDAADCLQSVVAICADSLRADEFWLIEAADSAALERIQNLGQTRLKAKAEEAQDYSPEQYDVIQEAQQITIGNYYVLLVSPKVDALAEAVRGAAGN